MYIFQFYLLVTSTYNVVIKKVAKKVASKIYKKGGSVPRSREQLKKDKPILNSRQIRLAALKKEKRQERLAKQKARATQARAAENIKLGIKPITVSEMASTQNLGKAIGPGLAGTPKEVMKGLRSQRKLKQKIQKQNRLSDKGEQFMFHHQWEPGHRSGKAPWLQNRSSINKWLGTYPSLGGYERNMIGVPKDAKLRITPYVKQKSPTEPPPLRNSFINRMNRQFSDEELRSAGYGYLIKRKNKKGWKG